MRVLALTSFPDRWRNVELRGTAVEVAPAVAQGKQLMCGEGVAIRDYDFFIIDVGTSIPDELRTGRRDATDAIGEMLAASAKMAVFATRPIPNCALAELTGLDMRVVDPPGREMVFDASRESRALERFAELLRYEVDWPSDLDAFATTKAGRGVATYRPEVLVVPAADDGGPTVLETLLSIESEWLPHRGATEIVESELPSWALEMTWPRLQERNAVLESARDAVRMATDMLDHRESEFGLERRWVGLLTLSGNDLEPLVRDALALLGIALESPSETEREDLRGVIDGSTLIVEVTGSARPVDVDKVRQLDQWVGDELARQAEAGLDEPTVGVLIGNAYRQQPLSERNPEWYTDSARMLAERRGHRLLRTADLFDLVTTEAMDPDATKRWLIDR